MKNTNPLYRINFLELDLMIMATAYTRYNYTLISDEEYDKRSFELDDLIKKYPNDFKKSKGYKQFTEFNPSTSMGLESDDFEICGIVERLIKIDRSQ